MIPRFNSDYSSVGTKDLRSKESPTMVRKTEKILESISSGEKLLSNRDSTYDINIKDAYLVFRAMCKLSMKPIPQLEGYESKDE